jgi:hypothetical protein
VSKVNLVYSEMPDNRKLMQSRDATFDRGHVRHEFGACRKDRCSGTSRVNPVYSKMPVEKGFMQSRDAKTVPKACKIGFSPPN